MARQIAVVIYAPFPYASGGRETWLAHLLPALADGGYRATVYTRAATGITVHDLSGITGLRLRPVPGPGFGPAPLRRALLNATVALDIAVWVRRVTSALEEDGFGNGVIVGLGPIIDVTPGLRLRRRYPATRVLCAVHGRVAGELGHSLPWARPALGRMERASLRSCDDVVANGEDTRVWLSSFGVRSVVVPNGVDLARFSHPPTRLPPLLAQARGRGEAMLTMVATLRDIKGVRPFIRALAPLLQSGGPPFCAVFVGKGDADRYRRYARRYGVSDRVQFVGEQADVVPWLHGSDVSINLSGGAGIAIAAIEAMAAGTPVVAWDTPIYRQIIEHGRTGLLVPENDSEALAQALAELLADAALRERLAVAARAAVAPYDWSAAAAALLRRLDLAFADGRDGGAAVDAAESESLP